MKAVIDIEFDRKNMQRMFAMRMNTDSKEFNNMSDAELLQLCLSSIVKPYAIKVTDIKDEKWLKIEELEKNVLNDDEFCL